MTDARTLSDDVAAVPFWWHSIDLGGGVVTPGHKSPELLAGEWDSMRLPDLAGRSVLDIGAWDGWFSFTAERLGASRVVAYDHFVWSMDWSRWLAFRERNEQLPAIETIPEVWRPDELPGRRGFDIAHAALGSRVEPVVGDVPGLDAAAVGEFDVVFFLGVLYHLEDPLAGMRRLRSVTRGLAVVETEARLFADAERPLAEFVGDDRVHGDPNNWWLPSWPMARELCLAAGFSEVELLVGPPEGATAAPGEPLPYRLVFQARV